jgi:hypothetical protein
VLSDRGVRLRKDRRVKAAVYEALPELSFEVAELFG